MWGDDVRFIEHTIANLNEVLERADSSADLSRGKGFLQGLDACVKLCGVLALIVAVVITHSLMVMIGLFVLSAALGTASRVPWRLLAGRLWLGVLLFTGAIALPALILTPGPEVACLPLLHWPVTATGLRAAAQLLVRAETTATLAALLVLSTPWTVLLRALRVLHVPPLAILMLATTHRYILLFCRTAQDMCEARRSRVIVPLDSVAQRRIAAANGGVLFSKSLQLGGEVYLAMQSRGFRGDARLLAEPRLRSRDWLALAGFTAFAALAISFHPL
jgi:cobalt ECF transporter T component CbiQ